MAVIEKVAAHHAGVAINMGSSVFWYIVLLQCNNVEVRILCAVLRLI